MAKRLYSGGREYAAQRVLSPRPAIAGSEGVKGERRVRQGKTGRQRPCPHLRRRVAAGDLAAAIADIISLQVGYYQKFNQLRAIHFEHSRVYA
jgi:hypothetical protein